MIHKFIENLNMNAHFVFIVSKEYFERYQLKHLLETLTENPVKIVVVNDHPKGSTPPGKCEQILLCKDYLDLGSPVIVTSCTQLLEWDPNTFLYSLANPKIDGGILTFQNTHPRYSYVSLDEFGWIANTAMNKPISANASAGVFYWKRAFDLIKYSAVVVAKNLDSENKFSLILTFQEAIRDGLVFKPFECRRMWELSTPKDLDYYHVAH